MPIEFVYFDLGNILVSFDPARACQNVAGLFQITNQKAQELVYDSGLETKLELGELTGDQFFKLLCESLDRNEREYQKQDVLDAISDMFTPIDSMVQVIQRTREHVDRIGVLSNTCAAHWSWIRRQPWPIAQVDYDVKILSYEVGAMKPDPRIYEAAEQSARTPAGNILFIDDKQENIDAARKRGWQAEQCLGGDEAAAVIERCLGVAR